MWPSFRAASHEVRQRQREERRERHLAYARSTSLETVPQALGTIIGGIVLILLAEAFGIITTLDLGDVAALLSVLGVFVALGAVAIKWADARGLARTEETLQDAYAMMLDLARKRDQQIDDMRERGDL